MTGIQVLDRIVSLLNCFSSERPLLSVQELSQMTGIPRSSAYRLIEALVQEGFCAYDPMSRKYRLGPQVIYLAGIALESIELRRVAVPHMKKLMEACGESVNLSIMEGKYRLCIEKVEGVHFLEFGIPEAMWHLRVKNFAAIVTMDAHGNSLHEEVEKSSLEKLAKFKDPVFV